MKTSICIISLVTALSIGINASPQSCKSAGWYCAHRTDGLQPECPSEMDYINDYGGYYIDKTHGDDKEDKVIYLTFDAGYENGNVEKIVDTLNRKNVSGAFFILEHLIDSNPELVKIMAENGNEICNHTVKHTDMSNIKNADEFRDATEPLAEKYKNLTGREMCRYFRPPEGRISQESLKIAEECGYKTVLWSFAYADWDNANQPEPVKSMEKILKCTHNGMVILLHPTSKVNAEILGDLIDEWKEMGYRFGTLEELTSGEMD